MNISDYPTVPPHTIIELFKATFTDSEGEQEGQTIAALVDQLIKTTDQNDLYGYCMTDQNSAVACVFFSRFLLPDNTVAFMLSPMAVATHCQQQGLGQRLIQHGLQQLSEHNVELVVTYGDPAFYGKTGFQSLSEQQIKAPYTLTHPEGWLVKSLSAQDIPSLPGTTHCAPAFQNPAYW